MRFLIALSPCGRGLGEGTAALRLRSLPQGERRLMGHLGLFIAAFTGLAPAAAQDRPAVDVSAPQKLAVTMYRDPDRGAEDTLNRDWPEGFAMISETRTVTLPAGRSTLRFTGVAEGMVAISAIVTGLPGGTIEKNRNSTLLSPAALVDGSLGNRVTITRTNPATGKAASESAVVRTRADGGLVLQTREGFEAVRCSGLPEKLTFDQVPAGLSDKPVFTLDTHSPQGGTYTITLTYLAWGFDWDASYVGRLRPVTFGGAGADGRVTMDLMSWLTLVNSNGQSFPEAELMAVAGKLNVESDFQELADPPQAAPLQLVCYPLGSTAAGSPLGYPPPPPPPSPPMMEYSDRAENIVVTGQRLSRAAIEAPSPVTVIAGEEVLGDLKLYRVPEPVTVAANSQKQVAFLDKKGVSGRFVYVQDCDPFDTEDESDLEPSRILFATENTDRRGLGIALPQGGLTLYEPARDGVQLVAETRLRDFAKGEDIELELAQSAQVQTACGGVDGRDTDGDGKRWGPIHGFATNANPAPVTVRFRLGWSGDWRLKGVRGARLKDGFWIVEERVPANSRRRFEWQLRRVAD